MKTVRFSAFLLSSLLSLQPIAAWSAETSTDLHHAKLSDASIRKGEQAASRGDWNGARRFFAFASQLNPQNFLAFYDLGIAHFHLRDYQSAVTAERQAIAINPRYAPAYIELGLAYNGLQQYEDAIRAEVQALEIDPNNATAKRNLDAIKAAFRRANRTVTAMLPPAEVGNQHASVESAPLAAAPGTIDSASGIAHILAAGDKAYRDGDLAQAKRCFEQAIAADPRSSEAHSSLGVVLGSMGDLDAQIAEAKKAIELDEENAPAHANLAWALAKKENWGEAMRSYDKALSLKPSLVDAQVGRALALANTGQMDAAGAALQDIKRLHPKVVGAYIVHGSVLFQQGAVDLAESELHQALLLEPNNRDAQQLMASILLHAAKAGEAERLLRKIASNQPKNASTHAGLSLALELQGDHDGAEKEARVALGLNPRVRIAQVTLDRMAQKKDLVR